MTREELLSTGSIDVLGRLPYSTNNALLVSVRKDGEEAVAVYKPGAGERPLWDFPAGTLPAREVAAYLISEAAGWGLVPPTVLRSDAPAGPGSLQVFVDHDPNRHFFVLIHDHAERTIFHRFATFDIVINNADRKGGHILEDATGRLWGVDHGLSFNVDPKLRTVIWAFAGEALPAQVLDDLDRLASEFDDGALRTRLTELLAVGEVAETRARIEYLRQTRVYPQPDGPYATPWPLL